MYQWFLIALSVRPFKCFAISAHLLPSLQSFMHVGCDICNAMHAQRAEQK